MTQQFLTPLNEKGTQQSCQQHKIEHFTCMLFEYFTCPINYVLNACQYLYTNIAVACCWKFTTGSWAIDSMALAGPLLFFWCGDQAWHCKSSVSVCCTGVPLTMPNPMAVRFTPVFSASHGELDPSGSSNEPHGGPCISGWTDSRCSFGEPSCASSSRPFRGSNSYSRLGVHVTLFSEEGARATTRIVEPGTSGR